IEGAQLHAAAHQIVRAIDVMPMSILARVTVLIGTGAALLGRQAIARVIQTNEMAELVNGFDLLDPRRTGFLLRGIDIGFIQVCLLAIAAGFTIFPFLVGSYRHFPILAHRPLILRYQLYVDLRFVALLDVLLRQHVSVFLRRSDDEGAVVEGVLDAAYEFGTERCFALW